MTQHDEERREEQRKKVLEQQLTSVLADFPPRVQADVLLDLLVGRAWSGHSYDLDTLIDMLTEIRDYGGEPKTWPDR